MSEAASEPSRGPITIGLMIAMFMGTLDQTVVSVSLPHMQGSLQATQDQITWVVTSYMVATAVTMPISGWIAARFGLKAMLLTFIGFFTFSSLLCGLAATMPEMVAVRFAQGVAYAPIAPLSLALLLKVYPPERFGRAVALFTMAGVAGPVVGPALGGLITDNLSWRWCFYINLPTGIISFALLWLFQPRDATAPRRFDFLGFVSLGVAIAALQLMLDRGPSHDWFDSVEIRTEAVVAAIGAWVYVTHTLTTANPLFDRGLARDRNFIVGATLQFLFTMLFYCSVSLLPLILQNVMGYPAATAGILTLPRSLLVIAILQVMGRLDAAIDRRALATFGFATFAVSCWLMSGFDLSMGPGFVLYSTLVQGLGQAFANAPISTLALVTLGASLRTDASTVSSLVRNMAGSIGISIMQWLMVFNGQRMHASLAAHIQPGDPVVRAALPPALSPDTIPGVIALNAEVTRQATMTAFVGNYRVMFVVTLLCIPLLMLTRKPRPARPLPVQAKPPEPERKGPIFKSVERARAAEPLTPSPDAL
jgi:DHA2 family multidrug resistance protein